MVSVLVAGGAGFLGSHLVEYLCDRGDNVTVVDNLSTNAVGLEFFRGRCDFVQSNIEQFDPAGRRFDVIYHLASLVGPIRIMRHAGTIFQQITNVTSRLTELARRETICVVSRGADLFSKDGVQFVNKDGSGHTQVIRPALRKLKIQYIIYFVILVFLAVYVLLAFIPGWGGRAE